MTRSTDDYVDRARLRLAPFDKPTRRAVLLRRGEELPEDLRADFRLMKQITNSTKHMLARGNRRNNSV